MSSFNEKGIGVPSGVERPEFLVDKAYEALRKAILSNSLKPGDQLSEASLSEQLGISRTPIREALKRLEKEGLVEIFPRRGAFITNISAEDITEIFQLREALECFAIRFVPRYGDPFELDQLVTAFEQSPKWIEVGDYDKVNRADTRLHRYIANSSQNGRLIKSVEQLLNQVIRLRYMTPTMPGRLTRQAEEHLRIVHALKAGQVDEAKEELRHHIRTVRDTYLEIRLRIVSEEPDDEDLSIVPKR